MDGQKIREALQAEGRSLADLASFLGISPQNLNGILSKDNIKTATLEGAAQFLQKPISFFYNEGNVATIGGNGNAAAGGIINDSILIDEIAAQRRMTEQALSQNDRLIGIIQDLSKKVK